MIIIPASISIIVICDASTLFIYFALNKVNKVPKNAANIPYRYPCKYCISAPKTYAKAANTTTPITTSYNNSFLLKNIGSINAEKREEVAKQTTATDTVDTLIDLKKQSQCKVTIAPTPNIPKKSFLLIVNNRFLYAKKSIKVIKAISILYHTKWVASKVINLPNTPVNPKMTTIRCRDVFLCLPIILNMD